MREFLNGWLSKCLTSIFIRYLIRNRRRKYRLLIQNRRGPLLENSWYFERTEGEERRVNYH